MSHLRFGFKKFHGNLSLVVLWVFTAMVVFGSSLAFAVDSSGIETVMRKYQNKYHYVAVVNINYNSKYLVWEPLHCSDVPSYPTNFFGEITEAEAELLVDDIVNKFYETGTAYTNISSKFLEQLPEGVEDEQTVIITRPPAADSWQDRLTQVDSDIDKLLYYKVGSAGSTAPISRSGYGDDYPEGSKTDGTWVDGSFEEAESEAQSNWGNSTSSNGETGVVTWSQQYHGKASYWDNGTEIEYFYNNYSTYTRSRNKKLRSDLSKHNGTAHCYLKLDPYNYGTYSDYTAEDGIASYNPVDVDGKFHSWGSPSTGGIWTSSYLFSTDAPDIEEPSRTTVGPDAEDRFTKVDQRAWSLGETLIVVEPVFENETDAVVPISDPNELVYKDRDKHTVYSAGDGCGYEKGETVKGRIIVNDYVPGMKIEVKLNDVFSAEAAKLQIQRSPNQGYYTIPCDSLEEVCCTPQEGDPNSYYVPYTISAYIGEDQVSFATAAVYAKALGDDATDPNEAQRIIAYRSGSYDFTFKVTTNGYECCNRKETLNEGNDIPQISKHENGDIEIYFPDIEQAYIWGYYSSMFPNSPYPKNCDFLDMLIAEYIPDGGSSGDYIKLFGPLGGSLVYDIDANWLATGTAANAPFIWELDADGNVIKTAIYDENGRLSIISNAADPDNFYREYSYNDSANPDRMTSYTDYAGDNSRTYTLVYDESTGRLAGTIGGTAGGCSSCSSSDVSLLYTYDDFGNILTESDSQSSVIYEYEYDTEDRLIAKWLGAKSDAESIQIIEYGDYAGNFGGTETKDVYEYTLDGDYSLTRYISDGSGRAVAEIAFDELNVDASMISSDPNVVFASSAHVTTYEYEYETDGITVDSIIAKSPKFNDAMIYIYHKNTLNNSSNTFEDDILVRSEPNGFYEEVIQSRNKYSTPTLNGVSTRRISESYDAIGIEDDVYTYYSYNTSNGQQSGYYQPIVYQLNGASTRLNYDYTYYADGRIQTETVSNNGEDASEQITTYLYDYLGHSKGTETRDHDGNLLYSTKTKCNGFGEEVCSVDKSGVARGKEYDSMGKVLSEFVFYDPADTAGFDDPNACTEDVSGVYTTLDVVSQTRRVYDSLGRVSEVKVAVSEDVFVYDTPDSWYITSYGYDSYGRKIQKVEDTTGLYLTTTYEYDNQGQIVKTTYPDGRWQKQICNGRGLVIKTINGYGPEDTTPNDFIVNETVYDADGNVVKELKAGVAVKSYELDNRGMVFREYQGDYETDYCDYTEYARDIAGNIISQKTVGVDGTTGNGTIIYQTKSRYNARGERIEARILANPTTGESDLNDKVTLYNYDVFGRQVETVVKADGNDQIYITGYYDTVDYQAGDSIVQNWYGLTGNLEYSLKFEYVGDSASTYDLPFSSSDDALRYTKDSQEVHVVSYNYTDSRLSDREVLVGFDEDDPDFNNNSYPQAGLLWREVEAVEYDSAGRKVKTYDADENFTTVSYNSRNQQIEQILWQGQPIFRASDVHDPNSIFDPYKLRTTLLSYDDAGRASRNVLLNDPNSSVDIDSVNLAVDRVTDYVYDDYGRVYRERKYFDNANQRIALKEYSYDGLGRADSVEFCELEEVDVFGSIWETKFPQRTISYLYNTKGQKVQQTLTNTNTLNGQTADIDAYYSYDLQGRLEEIENATGITFSCKYDALGRKTEETGATGKVTQYGYYYTGELASKTEDPTGLNRVTGFEYDRFGRQTVIEAGNDQTDYDYNYLGQVTDIDYPGGDSIAYGYDMLGAAIRRTVTKNSQSNTTHYKRNVLGRVSYKQYTNEIEWSEPNSLLPFDEILYDAAGNKQIVANIDGESDLELNIYSYDGLGNLASTAESYGGFSSSVGYGYDQRGLITSMTYPNGKMALFARDAIGRVESVTYDGKVIATYGWLGDAVISKTMAGADIKYAAVVDTLGRITSETFSNISDSQSFISNSYGYTTHSGRMDERNDIDYTFDTLGKLTAEDSTSYTSDILGNPTNATDDGLIYTFNNEDRVVDVDDTSGDVASYSYDRLGRRAKKTIGNVATYFVYDIMGNVIAEYEKIGTGDTEWTRDYVYGSRGEAVYMQIPQTSTMNTSFDNFVSFIDAWLCYPDCTQDDLLWDINSDDQINMIDWAAAVDANDFKNAFTINGRYLLTDSHNSVVGKVNTDGSVDEISYDAWGSPSYIGDLEGLSILWNGYYYDDETDNYYLRNRYYSPVERRFLTDDPHGINPDGNWNNWFAIRDQYDDGYGLRVYAKGDPVNAWDGWGLAVVVEPPNSGGVGSSSDLKSYALLQMSYLRARHEKFAYYRTTGLSTAISRVTQALNSHPDKYWRERKSGDPQFDGKYISISRSAAPDVVFHEGIHVYNEQTGFGGWILPKKDEAVAYAAANYMLDVLPALQSIERHLSKPVPSKESLKKQWGRFWRTTNRIVGSDYHWFYASIPFTSQLTESDIGNVNSQLDYRHSCGELKALYNKMAKNKKTLGCFKFTCKPSAISADEAPTTVPLHSVFK